MTIKLKLSEQYWTIECDVETMAQLQCARASYEFITIQLLDQCQSNLIFNSLFSWPFLPRRNCLSTYNCLIKPVMMYNWTRTRSGTNRFQKDFLPNILSNSLIPVPCSSLSSGDSGQLSDGSKSEKTSRKSCESESASSGCSGCRSSPEEISSNTRQLSISLTFPDISLLISPLLMLRY